MKLLSKSFSPDTAMVLAAGLGKRMRPLTNDTPKPLIKVAGKPLIDHALSRVNEAGVKKVIVNVHYLADLLEEHLASLTKPEIVISNERDQLLETAGGIKLALPLIGEKPFLVFNSDSLWIEGFHGESELTNIQRLLNTWSPDIMDVLLLLVDKDNAFGFDGPGDYFQDYNGLLTRRSYATSAPFVYAGVAIVKPELFTNLQRGPISLNEVFDKAQSRKRLVGMTLHGQWLHIGTPESIAPAEKLIHTVT